MAPATAPPVTQPWKYSCDLLNRRQERFVLWIPHSHGAPADFRAPRLILGTYDESQTDGEGFRRLNDMEMTCVLDKPGLWEYDLASSPTPIPDGVYHYFFQVVDDSSWARTNGTTIMEVTDPLAYTVHYNDYRQSGSRKQPCSIIKYRDGRLWNCNEHGEEHTRCFNTGWHTRTGGVGDRVHNPSYKHNLLVSNNQMVMYELPTTWAKPGLSEDGSVEVDIGTFKDVRALFVTDSAGDRFRKVETVANEQMLAELGITCLQLLPTADAKPKGTWGYATADYFSVDRDMGDSKDFVSMVDMLHWNCCRVLLDVVMAFGHDPYIFIDRKSFHIDPKEEPDNHDSYQSRAGDRQLREGFGGANWRYLEKAHDTYDPITGEVGTVQPAWAFHLLNLERWMADFMVDGWRIDSVNNVANWHFIHHFRERAWEHFSERQAWTPDDGKFLIVGEELSMPMELVHGNYVNAIWNKRFQERIRAVLLGEGALGDDFEWTVRKMFDCRLDGFEDGSQAINYITSHDVEGPRNERLYNFLDNAGVADKEQRAKLAFTCLLTAIGIPMIFAGEEFCDQHDVPVGDGQKQMDPVNYARKNEPWRKRVFEHVAVLSRLRKDNWTFMFDNLELFHVDMTEGRKIFAFKREVSRDGYPTWWTAIVVNFSDVGTPEGHEYFIPNWPGRESWAWREVTEHREVGKEVGKDAIKPWDAKVYIAQHVFSRAGPYPVEWIRENWEPVAEETAETDEGGNRWDETGHDPDEKAE